MSCGLHHGLQLGSGAIFEEVSYFARRQATYSTEDGLGFYLEALGVPYFQYNDDCP